MAFDDNRPIDSSTFAMEFTVGEVVKIVLEMDFDLTAFVALQLRVRKDENTLIEKDAVIDTETGTASFTFEANEFDVGTYKAQLLFSDGTLVGLEPQDPFDIIIKPGV